ncbi:mavicyanin-like [Mangifera indica]|uniref:mavicyanin-like n=1 Tax=Mangifera indica TaxID=29780 RepID=UPI001CF9D678|nr:mavicyanin-like [Mangifera indica]
MAMAKSAVIVFSIIALFGAAMAASYDVGDTAGWTTKDMPDYKKWADDKDFKVGDTLVFKYNQEMHDVMQVSKADFEACSAKSPIAKYTTGADKVTLKEPGKTYFLCSFPGHCEKGQKVEIEVEGTADGPAAGPSGANASSPTGTASGDASSSTASAAGADSSAASTSSESSSSTVKLSGGLGWALASVAAAFAF